MELDCLRYDSVAIDSLSDIWNFNVLKQCYLVFVGKRWCNRNDYDDADEDDVAAELADGNVENCAYLEFTHDFPFGDDMENANKTEKRLAQFKIMQHCYRYGVPPPHIEHKHAWDFDDIDPNNPMRTFKSASKGMPHVV